MPTIETTKSFDNDLIKCHKRNLNLELLEQAVNMLEQTGTLTAKYKPHPLKKNLKGYFDAHILFDWLLIWEHDLQKDKIILHRTGRHVDIFKNFK